MHALIFQPSCLWLLSFALIDLNVSETPLTPQRTVEGGVVSDTVIHEFALVTC